MEDTSIAPPDEGMDKMSSDVEIPVNGDTLAIDGIRPEIGDRVDLKVSGSVTRVVNDVAYVKPETVNDQPLPSDMIKPDPMVSEDDRLERMSQSAGDIYTGP